MFYIILYFKRSIYLQDKRTIFYFLTFHYDISFLSPYIYLCLLKLLHCNANTLLEVYQKAVNTFIKSAYYTTQLCKLWISRMKFIAHASTWLCGVGMF
jgi:hypothetical protein